MSKSAIYTVNSSAQNVAVNGTINLGQIIRRFGPNLNLNGNAITVAGGGYYDIEASFTLAPTAAGNVIITAYKDDSAIPGATATATATAANDIVNLSISSIVRESCACCEGLSNITFVLSGTASSITNSAIVGVKL